MVAFLFVSQTPGQTSGNYPGGNCGPLTVTLRCSCRPNSGNRPRQPEMIPVLQVKMFVVAGLLDAVPMIGVGVGLFLLFANPFVAMVGG